ncbi:hypothetical protein [Rubellimicrobium roseum]|uniref:hypothetical protein n=1 Tax=Rubellimicrobium roseum TaxID=687525 RepID=UPI00159BEB8A|nr:hypothetical protein [Rubellimicrobium roseum]
MNRLVSPDCLLADRAAHLPRATLTPFRVARLDRLPEERRVGPAVSTLRGHIDLPD